jgi:hypothetical protein
MMQIEQNAYSSLIYNLPKIAEQLEIANKLKAIELKLKIDKSVKAPYEWAQAVDNAMNS